MKRFMVTLYVGKSRMTYHVEMPDKKTFSFEPSLRNIEAPAFILTYTSSHWKAVGTDDERLIEQAKKEVKDKVVK